MRSWFTELLGPAFVDELRPWGSEKRYVLDERMLAKHIDAFRSCVRIHLSSFDYAEELQALGCEDIAQAIADVRVQLPEEDELATRMGFLGEILGAEFASETLGYQTTLVFPKRYNPNMSQSMKGIDILGFRSFAHPPELLIGESKCSSQLNRSMIEEGYASLVKDQETRDLSVRLMFAYEISNQKQGDVNRKNVYRHLASNIPRRYLLLSVTPSQPTSLTELINSEYQKRPLDNLLLVHIQIKGLRTYLLDQLFQT